MTKLVSALSKREREFIEKLQRNVDVKKNYPNVTVRQLKFRLLTKRKILTEDLLLLNAVLDKLQSL